MGWTACARLSVAAPTSDKPMAYPPARTRSAMAPTEFDRHQLVQRWRVVQVDAIRAQVAQRLLAHAEWLDGRRSRVCTAERPHLPRRSRWRTLPQTVHQFFVGTEAVQRRGIEVHAESSARRRTRSAASRVRRAVGMRQVHAAETDGCYSNGPNLRSCILGSDPQGNKYGARTRPDPMRGKRRILPRRFLFVGVDSDDPSM